MICIKKVNKIKTVAKMNHQEFVHFTKKIEATKDNNAERISEIINSLIKKPMKNSLKLLKMFLNFGITIMIIL